MIDIIWVEKIIIVSTNGLQYLNKFREMKRVLDLTNAIPTLNF